MVGITHGSDVFDYRRPVTDFCDRVEHEKRATMLDGESGPPTMVESVTVVRDRYMIVSMEASRPLFPSDKETTHGICRLKTKQRLRMVIVAFVTKKYLGLTPN